MKTLCTICARKGSKGLKNKNILKIKDKELIYYPIAAAKNSKYVDYVLFSSDSKKFIKIAKRYKAHCPFIRPKKFSSDNKSIIRKLTSGLAVIKKTEEGFIGAADSRRDGSVRGE